MQKTLLAIIAAAVVTIGLTVNFATATHEPADKTAGTASSIDEVGQTGVTLLEEKMRVSSTSDLILSTTAECSILTSLNTSGGPNTSTETDSAFGQVRLWITIDGKAVPVQSSGAPNDDGKVVFCNRAYQRTVTDREEDENPLPTDNGNGDGIDSEDDFIRTRAANGFNWMAFNVGRDFDTDKNNVVTVKLIGEFTRQSSDGANDPACAKRPDNDVSPYTNTCADAFVGKRSLIVEAVHASNHEQTSPTGQ